MERVKRVKPSLWGPVLIALVLGLTLWVYKDGLSDFFIFDDAGNILPLKISTLNWETVTDATLNNRSGELGRPVSTFTLVLSGYFSDMSPAAFKRHNLVIHLLTGLLLMWLAFLILRHLLGREQERRAALIAICAGAVWLLHPLLVSTVLYAVQRMAQLSALFLVAALITYVYGRQRLLEGRSGGLAVMVAGTLGFGTLSVLSKENGVLLPLFILTLEAVVFRFRVPGAEARRALRIYLIALVAVPLVLGGLFALVTFDRWLAGYGAKDFTMAERLYTQAQLLFYYLYLIVSPKLSQLNFYQDGFGIVRAFDLTTGIAVVALVAAVVWAWQWRQRAPLLALGIFWYLIAHLLESSVIPLEMAFEHRNYLAAFGVILALVYTLLRPYEGGERAVKYQWLLFGAVTAVLATMTHDRAGIWSDLDRIVAKNYHYSPDSLWATQAMANRLIDKGGEEKAKFILNKAYATFPDKWAGIALQQIRAYCRDDAVPMPLMERARSRLLVDKPGPFIHHELKTLQTRFSRGLCPAFRPEHFAVLTGAAMQNPLAAPGREYFLWYGLLHGNSLMYLNRYEEAMALYDALYDQSGGGSSAKALLPLFEKLRWQIALGRFYEAELGLEFLADLNRRSGASFGHKIEAMRQALEEQKARQGQAAGDS